MTEPRRSRALAVLCIVLVAGAVSCTQAARPFETLPANELELGLWLESDRMGYLLDVVDQPSLSNQQDVVRNERRQSIENQPYGIVEEAMYHTLYPKGHPYYADVIGSHADIQA